MAFHVLAAPENAAGWLLSIILTPICILATLLRFVATKRSGRTVGWEDWWALLALIFFIPYVVYLLMGMCSYMLFTYTTVYRMDEACMLS